MITRWLGHGLTALWILSASGIETFAKFPEPISSQTVAERLANQQLMLKRAQAEADRFIERWHATLDIEVLFNEMYVADPVLRRQNIYGLINTAPDNYKRFKHLDEQVVKEAFMAFINMQYLDAEYRLTLPKEVEKGMDHDEYLPPEIQAALETMEDQLLKDEPETDKPITNDTLRKDASQMNHLASLCRKYLTPDKFNSPIYIENLKDLDTEVEGPPIRFGTSRFSVDNDREIYHFQRGVFEFYFIEEAGALKVLTLGFGS